MSKQSSDGTGWARARCPPRRGNTPGVKSVRDDLIWMEPTSGMLIDSPEENP